MNFHDQISSFLMAISFGGAYVAREHGVISTNVFLAFIFICIIMLSHYLWKVFHVKG